VATAAIQKRAQRFDVAQRRIEMLGVKDAVRQSRALRQAVINPVSWRNERQRALKAYAELLSEGMVAAYLLGIVQVVQQAREDTGERLAMSLLDDELSRLAVESQAFTPAFIEGQRRRFGKVGAQLTAQIDGRLTQHVDLALKRLRAEGISTVSAEGQTQVRAAFAKAGVGPEALGKPYLLETMFRTQTQVGYAVGREAAVQNPLIDEQLWGYEYVTMGDDRVRAEHAAMEGVTLPKADPYWTTNTPPNGWNCRCQKLLVFKDEAPATPTEPEVKKIDGKPTEPVPDKGWAFDPGKAFGDVLAARPPLFAGEVLKTTPIPRRRRVASTARQQIARP